MGEERVLHQDIGVVVHKWLHARVEGPHQDAKRVGVGPEAHLGAGSSRQ